MGIVRSSSGGRWGSLWKEFGIFLVLGLSHLRRVWVRGEQISRGVLLGTLSEFAMTQAQNRPNEEAL